MNSLSPKQKAPVQINNIKALRSYEDRDELYWEDYCKGLGDPDYYGYPGEKEVVIHGRDAVDQKPF